MKVKILILIVASLFMLSAFYAQDNIKAEKEILSVLKYGTADTFSKLITVDYDDIRFGSYYYPVENGLLIEYVGQDNGPYRLGVEVNSDLTTNVISKFDSKDWLEKQKGNYKIFNNKIYKNNMLWTPNDNYELGAYIGRLKSGHCIFATYDNPQDLYMREFVITRPDGTIEISLEIPWSASNIYEEGKSFYSWSFGNWGELYSLIAPPIDSEGYWNNGKKEIELVVSRNYLKYFGILNDDRIRLRKGPGTNTESLGTYPIKTGFRILETSGVKQTIGGVTDEWIKVRLLDGTEGYFFGQYVQNLYDGPGTPLPWPNVADWE